MDGSPIVGILALQGDFAKHRTVLQQCDVRTVLIRKQSELSAVDALVLPGGESTALLRLLDDEFRQALTDTIGSGVPTLATCAGLILLATEVENPSQESLQLLDVSVSRNAYGRQVDSFICTSLEVTEEGKKAVSSTVPILDSGNCSKISSEISIEGVFIRAPRITRVGQTVSVLCKFEGEPVLVQQENIIAASFHPELNQQRSSVHTLFLNQLR